MDKKIPKLHTPNMIAARAIIKAMREGDRVLSETAFRREFAKARGWNTYRADYALSTNYETTKKYLINRGLITLVGANGFVFWVLTQKGFRSRWDNIFPTQPKVTERQINEAADFVEKMWQYMEPIPMANYFSDKIFSLKGDYKEKFANQYFVEVAEEADSFKWPIVNALKKAGVKIQKNN